MKELKSCGIYVIKYLKLSPYTKNWNWAIFLSFGFESLGTAPIFHSLKNRTAFEAKKIKL